MPGQPSAPSFFALPCDPDVVPEVPRPLDFTIQHAIAIEQVRDESYTRRVPRSGRLRIVDGTVVVDLVTASDGGIEKWPNRLLSNRHGEFIWRTLVGSNFTVDEVAELLRRSWIDRQSTDALLLGSSLVWRVVITPPRVGGNRMINACLEQVSSDLKHITPTTDNINSVLRGFGRVQRLMYTELNTTLHPFLTARDNNTNDSSTVQRLLPWPPLNGLAEPLNVKQLPPPPITPGDSEWPQPPPGPPHDDPSWPRPPPDQPDDDPGSPLPAATYENAISHVGSFRRVLQVFMERQIVLTNQITSTNSLVSDEAHTALHLLQQHRIKVILNHIDGTQRLFRRFQTQVPTKPPDRAVANPAYTTPIMERMGRSHALIKETLGSMKMPRSHRGKELVLVTPPEIQTYLTFIVEIDPSALPIASDSAPSPPDRNGDASAAPQAGDLSVDLTPILRHIENTRRAIQAYLESASIYPVTPAITNADSAPVYGVPKPPTACSQPPNLRQMVHGMVLRRVAMKHVDTAFLQAMEIERKHIHLRPTDDRHDRELEDMQPRIVADHVQKHETCSPHSTFPPTLERTRAEVCSIYGECEVPPAYPPVYTAKDPVSSLDQKPLVDRVKTRLRDAERAWSNSGGPEAARFINDVAESVVRFNVGALKVSAGASIEVATALVKATKFAWNAGSEFVTERGPLTAQYVRHRTMSILSSLHEPKTAAEQEILFLVSGIVSADCATAAELEAWAGLRDKILDTLNNMTRLVSDRALLHLREQMNRDTRIIGSGGDVKMKTIVGLLYTVLTESGAYKIMDAEATPGDSYPVITAPGPYLARLDDQILSVYPNDARSVNLLMHLSGLPNEIAVEKLNSDRSVLRELEAVYSDRFSVNHAMIRLQQLDPVALQLELGLIKRYARDPEPVRVKVLSAFPDHMRGFKKELGDLLTGMTLEQMMYSTLPRVASDTRHNILGMKGPWLDSKHEQKPGEIQFLESLRKHQSQVLGVLKQQQKHVAKLAEDPGAAWQIPERDMKDLERRQTRVMESLRQNQRQHDEITENLRTMCRIGGICGPDSEVRTTKALHQHMLQIVRVIEGADAAHQILSTCRHGDDKMRVAKMDRYQTQLTTVIADAEAVCPAPVTGEMGDYDGHAEVGTLASYMWYITGAVGLGVASAFVALQFAQGDISPLVDLAENLPRMAVAGEVLEEGVPAVGDFVARGLVNVNLMDAFNAGADYFLA